MAALHGTDSRAVHEAIVFIAEVAYFNIRGIESDIVPEANEERLSPGELLTLKRALLDFVERDPFGSDAGSAIWGLSKFCDREMIKTYQVWLKRYVDHLSPEAFALGQTLVSLHNLGERAITGGSFSADEFGKNFSDAVAYLNRQQDRPTKESNP
ncbi:MAG TPA: hypothetical protein VMV72_03805 [Verrucomicrobiae bacterium]|nr:hypothetical protein [Verrucomicrobiae bacterium]